MKITLTQKQYEKLENLEEGEIMELTYKGIDCWIEPNDVCPNIQYKGRGYLFNFFCPSEVKLSVKKEEKENAITFIGAEFQTNKMHVYDVKTSGKHPVHLIEGGEYITEDQRDFGTDDMGWFWLNQKEYDYFKSQCHEITIEVRA